MGSVGSWQACAPYSISACVTLAALLRRRRSERPGGFTSSQRRAVRTAANLTNSSRVATDAAEAAWRGPTGRRADAVTGTCYNVAAGREMFARCGNRCGHSTNRQCPFGPRPNCHHVVFLLFVSTQNDKNAKRLRLGEIQSSGVRGDLHCTTYADKKATFFIFFKFINIFTRMKDLHLFINT